MMLNSKAWDLLLDDEKMALSLQLGMEKSTWESGEILNRSHYKYLEIKYRAEYFLKTFTEHLDLFHEVFPDYISGNKMVIQYFKFCVVKRYKPLKALDFLSKEFPKISKKSLNEQIIITLKKWDREDNAYNKAVMELVKDFDRWNNFRILPKEIQEPSAFKRRIKNVYKKQIRVLKSIHPIALEKLRKLYETRNPPYVYVPIFIPEPQIYRMKINKGSMAIFNSLGMYTFKDKNMALKYINEINLYMLKGKKDCLDGLDFWPKYRDLIKRAYNYHAVMQITSSRKHLQLAMEKFQLL